jgi:hypothetical protein
LNLYINDEADDVYRRGLTIYYFLRFFVLHEFPNVKEM